MQSVVRLMRNDVIVVLNGYFTVQNVTSEDTKFDVRGHDTKW